MRVTLLRPEVLDSIFPLLLRNLTFTLTQEPWDNRNCKATELTVHDRFIVCCEPFTCYGLYYVKRGFPAPQRFLLQQSGSFFLLADFNCPVKDQNPVGAK